jgi:hypothetical protein
MKGARRLQAIRQFCFSAIACVEEFGFVARLPLRGMRREKIMSPTRSLPSASGAQVIRDDPQEEARSSLRVPASSRAGTTPVWGKIVDCSLSRGNAHIEQEADSGAARAWRAALMRSRTHYLGVV